MPQVIEESMSSPIDGGGGRLPEAAHEAHALIEMTMVALHAVVQEFRRAVFYKRQNLA